ncbi:mitochondrial import receptor subunit TOM20 homolog [Amphiura filiformis]|uniref:mitochondrial import receptor subunit TOM20 homolog n=1 Tax=Amphiura filiformis TaxID=82378 RepID=UPI003B213A53
MLSKSTFGIFAGVAGTLFIGYCIYFDRKRRSDPLFKQKLKEKRSKQKKTQQRGRGGAAASSTQLPDLKDPEAVQKFFLEQVQLGEELLAQGDFDNGVEHLSNAVAVCGQPQHLLQVLQQTLPQQVFEMLVQKLPATSKRISNSIAGIQSGPGVLVEDELE